MTLEPRFPVATMPEKTGQLRRKSATWYQTYSRILLGLDAVAVTVATWFAYWERGGDPFWFEQSEGFLTLPMVSIMLILCWMAALAVVRSRVPQLLGTGAEEYQRVVRGTFLVFGGLGILSIFIKVQLSRSYLLITLSLGIFMLVLFRWLARVVVGRLRHRHGRCITRLIVVGNARAVRELCVSLARAPDSEYRVVGVCLAGSGLRTYLDVPGIGRLRNYGGESKVVDAVIATHSEAVAVTATKRLVGPGLAQLSWALEEIDVDLLVAPGVIDVAGPRLHMRPVSALPLIHVEKPQYRGAKKFKKGMFDVLFSGLVLLCGLPVLLLIALAIKVSSRGPVFYHASRIGLDGRPFQMIKFRTMVVGADAMISDLTDFDLTASPRDPFKFRNDPRVTRVGAILR